MVGHSLGGFEALRFTDLHRQSVVGMVLVDPDIPNRAAVEERFAPDRLARAQAIAVDVLRGLRSDLNGQKAMVAEFD